MFDRSYGTIMAALHAKENYKNFKPNFPITEDIAKKIKGRSAE